MLIGCRGAPEHTSRQPTILSLEDVSQQLRDRGVPLGGEPDTVRAFFDGGLIAVIRYSDADPKADDQYIVIAYCDGKVASLHIGPPQFSVGHAAS